MAVSVTAPESAPQPERGHEHHTTAEEVRVAMALNGGVSLAVWMGGCAVELDAARRAHLGKEQMGEYPELGPPDRTLYNALCRAFRREVVIDLMSGSSAGGINGALLAAAVHKERRLHPDYIRDKWLGLGDLQKLLHPLRTPGPTSLMSGKSFHEQLLSTFEEILPTGDPEHPDETEQRLRIPENQRAAIRPDRRVLTTEVKLDVTTTDVLGQEHRFRDTWGEELIAHEYRQRFQFRGPEDYTPDRLAAAARASASFPLAFEPWPVDGRLLKLEGRRWVIDGGLLDNAPIRSVLDLIPVRPSSRKVQRFVCYVNADPPLAPTFEVEPTPGGEKPETPQLQDVLGYMVSLPRKATFVDHLTAIQRAAGRAVAVKEANESMLALPRKPLADTAAALLPAYRSRRRLLALEEHLKLEPALVSVADRRVRDAGGELPWIPESLDMPVARGEWGWGVRAATRVLHLMLDLIRHASDYLESIGTAQDDRQPLIDAREAIHDRLRRLEAIHERVTGDDHTGRLVASLAGEDNVKTTLCGLRCRLRDPQHDPAIHELVRETADTMYGLGDLLGLACAGDEDRQVAVHAALFGDAAPGPLVNDEAFRLFLERTLCVEVVRRAFSADEQVDTDQELAFAQITPCAPTLLLTDRPLHATDVPATPDAKLTGTRWAHFAGFYRESWRANDFMWGRLDAAVRIVDMLVEPERAHWVLAHAGDEPVAILTDALAPPEALCGEPAKDGRKRLLAEAMVDHSEVPADERFGESQWRQTQIELLEEAEPEPFRDRLRAMIHDDLFPPSTDGTRPGTLTRALCVRAAQWEVLLHEWPHVVARSQSDVEAGTSSAPLPPVQTPWEDVIRDLRGGEPVPKRLGSGDDAEQASTLMIRTATHSALVGMAAIRGTTMPLGKALALPGALLLPIAGLVARRLPYALAVAAAYWAFAVFVAGRVVSVGAYSDGRLSERLLVVLVTYLAALGVLTVCVVPFWRALRARHTGTTVSQLVWLCALLAAAFVPVGLVIASDITLTDVLLQSEAWRPWFLLTGLALLTVGFAWRMPGPVRRLFRVDQRAPFSGPKALAFTLAPWVFLAVASVVEPLRHALTDDGRDPLHVAAAIVALTAPPAVAAAYIAISNRRWRSRRR